MIWDWNPKNGHIEPSQKAWRRVFTLLQKAGVLARVENTLSDHGDHRCESFAPSSQEERE